MKPPDRDAIRYDIPEDLSLEQATKHVVTSIEIETKKAIDKWRHRSWYVWIQGCLFLVAFFVLEFATDAHWLAPFIMDVIGITLILLSPLLRLKGPEWELRWRSRRAGTIQDFLRQEEQDDNANPAEQRNDHQ